MNLPQQSGVGTLSWHTFRLPTPPDYRYRSPVDNKVRTILHRRNDATDWCMLYIKGAWTEGRSRGTNQHTFQFKDGKDAMLFKLTWCNETIKPKFS